MEIQAVDPEFVRVWSRVKGSAPKPEHMQEQPPGQEDRGEFLTGKLRAELSRRRSYLALGLVECARESLMRANKLRTAWFFCSGQTFWPTQLGQRTKYPNRGEAIRTLYHSEELSERDYLTAREGSENELLREVFAQCAQSCRKTRLALWQAIEGG